MKRIWVGILILSIAVSLTACGGNRGQTSEGGNAAPNAAIRNNSSQTDDSEPRGGAAETLIEWVKGGVYYFRYTAEIESAEGKTTSQGMTAVDGEQMTTYTETTVAGIEVKSKLLIRDGKTYLIDETSKSYIEVPADVGVMSDQATDFRAMEYVGGSSGELKGKTFPYEEYKTNEAAIRFYMEGKKVYAIESRTERSKTLMFIEENSKVIPAGAFDIPSGYAKLG